MAAFCEKTTLAARMEALGLSSNLEQAIRTYGLTTKQARELRGLPIICLPPEVTEMAGSTDAFRGKLLHIRLHPYLQTASLEAQRDTTVHEAAHALVVVRFGAEIHNITGAHGFLWRNAGAMFGFPNLRPTLTREESERHKAWVRQNT